MSELEIVTRLDASPGQVWRALTTGSELEAWYWPPSWPVTAVFEDRIGGAWRIASTEPALAASGEVLELHEGRSARLSWRWAGEETTTEVVLRIEDDADGGTVLTVRHGGFDDEATRQDHIAGWASCLDRLPDHLARQRG